MSTPAFRDSDPVAWFFHRNTSRWAFHPPPPAGPETPQPPKEYVDAPLVRLPAPRLPASTLADAIAARASCRRFGDEAIGLDDLSALLAAGYGVAHRGVLGQAEFLDRPVPSGGGLYPLELYVLAHRVDGLAPGIHHYAPLHHGLEQLVDVPVPPHVVADLFLGQPYVGDAGVVVVLTAVVRRCLVKYGDRGYRYVLFEAGHVAQNLNLAAAAAGLGSCNLGGFFDQDLADVLGLDTEEEVPVYGVAIGRPATADRAEMRTAPEE
jgi:SagB-type dehydrogenase family enzyme